MGDALELAVIESAASLAGHLRPTAFEVKVQDDVPLTSRLPIRGGSGCCPHASDCVRKVFHKTSSNRCLEKKTERLLQMTTMIPSSPVYVKTSESVSVSMLPKNVSKTMLPNGMVSIPMSPLLAHSKSLQTVWRYQLYSNRAESTLSKNSQTASISRLPNNTIFLSWVPQMFVHVGSKH